MQTRSIKGSRIFFSIGLFLIAITLFGIFLSPYGFLKSIGDYLSPDGNYKSFTPALFATLRPPVLIAGLVFLLAGIGMLVFSSVAERSLLYIAHVLRRGMADCKKLFRDFSAIRLNWKESLLLVAIFILGLIPRLLLLNRPIEYDEAYTFTQFARYPFLKIISDYSAPNNHVLNTILVRIVYLLLGDQAWQIRIPAFLAGLLIILCAYMLGRMLYNKTVGYLAAGMLAALPDFIIRSVSARGYTLVVLMTLLSFIMAGYLIRSKNLFGWCLLSLFGALGFYAVPIMVYPLGVVYLWLFLSIFVLDPQQYSRGNWIKYLIFSAILTTGLTVFFYSPILLSPNAVNIYHQNNTLHPLNFTEWFQIFPVRLDSLLTEWQGYLPPVWPVIIVIGLILSLVWIKKNNKFKVPTQLAFILALSLLLLIQRPDSVTRIWLWIVPLLAIWSSAGLVSSLLWIRSHSIRNIVTMAVPMIIIAGMAINAISYAYTAKINQWGEDPVAEEVTLAILPHITQNSYVAVNGCFDARYWFYFFNHGIPLSVFYKKDEARPFDRVFAIVYDQPKAGCGTEPVSETLRLYGPDPSLVDMTTLKPIKSIYYVTIYEILPRQ
jgi:4-amino-4-deoxy-L-arabinose transferase-like glycosyltransferase